jgi:predicted regulator of Ras-like GTPase activity (Roadblock/LC7/MglB family)
VLNRILGDLVSAVRGASAALFLDGDGEMIARAGDADLEIGLRGAWKEIHLDQIKEITAALRLGPVQAVLFSVDGGNELVTPVSAEYSLVLFLSPYSDLDEARRETAKAVDLILQDIS